MKKLVLLGVLVFCVVSLASSQWSATLQPYQVKQDSSINDVVDTTNTFRVGPANMVSVVYKGEDRYSVRSITIDYRPVGYATWTAVTDTIAAFAATSDGNTVYTERILRDGTKNLLPSVDGYFRLRVLHAASGNDSKRNWIYIRVGQ